MTFDSCSTCWHAKQYANTTPQNPPPLSLVSFVSHLLVSSLCLGNCAEREAVTSRRVFDLVKLYIIACMSYAYVAFLQGTVSVH